MKKFLSVLLLVCIVASVCSVGAWADSTQPDYPTATVGSVADSGTLPLTFNMMFKANDATPEQFEYYKLWAVDFVLTVNKDVRGVDGYLAGAYKNYNSGAWVKFEVDTEEVVIKANQGFYIMREALPAIWPELEYMPYGIVYEWVKEFKCGVYFYEDFIKENPDLYVTLELRLFNPNSPEQGTTIGEIYEFGTRPVAPNPPAPNNPAPVTPAAPVVEDIYYIPATDDNSNMALWSILTLALLSTAFVTRKRKNEN